MRVSFYFVFAGILALAACNRSASSVAPGNWQLLKKVSSIAGGNYVYTPAADSSVSLSLTSSDGMIMTTYADTLTLSSPPTPGGNISYTFIKR